VLRGGLELAALVDLERAVGDRQDAGAGPLGDRGGDRVPGALAVGGDRDEIVSQAPWPSAEIVMSRTSVSPATETSATSPMTPPA
jgi:hypothetical protein